MDIERGDIVLVDLDPTQGSEQGKTRPAVVIQNDVGNRYSPTTIIAPITSSYDEVYPVNVELEAGDTALDRDAVILLNQVRTVSVEHRIIDTRGQVPEEKMEEVDEAIEISLGLK